MIVKKKITILFFVMMSITMMSFTTPQKQVDKIVSKLWSGENISMTEIKLPEVGENIESGNVISIFVSVGDTVTKGEDLIELEAGANRCAFS